jgi:branched-chain amino acid transport system permease protein
MFWLKRLGSLAIGVAACFLIDIVAHHSLGDYQQRLVFLAALYVTLAVSLNLINGITGQFSIGHAAFYQIGAYSAGYISRRYITDTHHNVLLIPWLVLMILVGGAFSAVAGYIVGLPSLRLKGDYLAIVTLGFGEIVRIIVQNTDALGGSYALDKIPQIQPIWLVWLLAFTCIAVSRNLLKTARGLTFLAVREDEIASQAMGVNVTGVKVTAFVIGSAFAGAAGAMFAHHESAIVPGEFTMDVSFIILTMVVLGGTGSITGAIVAAMFLFYLPEYLRGLHTHDNQALQVSGALILGTLIALGVVVSIAKKVMDKGLGTPKQRGMLYLGLAVVAVPLAGLLGKMLSIFKPLVAIQIPTEQLRMVIFAVCLIVIMLLRPQGIFAHPEFSWSWIKKLFGGAAPKTEVAV